MPEEKLNPESVLTEFLGPREEAADQDAWDDMLTAMGGDDYE